MPVAMAIEAQRVALLPDPRHQMVGLRVVYNSAKAYVSQSAGAKTTPCWPT